jgi:predicted transcriptional regulator
MNKPVLPNKISQQDQAAFVAAVREGIEAADAGRLSPFEPVAEWLASWGADHECPPPK